MNYNNWQYFQRKKCHEFQISEISLCGNIVPLLAKNAAIFKTDLKTYLIWSSTYTKTARGIEWRSNILEECKLSYQIMHVRSSNKACKSLHTYHRNLLDIIILFSSWYVDKKTHPI